MREHHEPGFLAQFFVATIGGIELPGEYLARI
jgi:hypothetical protein